MAPLLIFNDIHSSYALWPVNPNDTVSICTANDNQTDVQSVTDDSGGVIIAWEDERNGFAQLFTQHLDATGTTVWQANGVLLVDHLDKSTEWHLFPDGEGGAVVFWTWEGQADTRNIHGQRISGNGQLLWGKYGSAFTDDIPLFSDFQVHPAKDQSWLLGYRAGFMTYVENFFGPTDNWLPLNHNRWEKIYDAGGDPSYAIITSDYEPDQNDRLGEYAVYQKDFPDFYRFSVDIRCDELRLQTPDSDYALLFGYIDEKNYSFVQIKQNIIKFRSIVKGTATPWLAEYSFNMTSKDFNQFNRYELEKIGTTVILTMDKQVFICQDNSFRRGRIGIGSWNDKASFDNVKIEPSWRAVLTFFVDAAGSMLPPDPLVIPAGWYCLGENHKIFSSIKKTSDWDDIYATYVTNLCYSLFCFSGDGETILYQELSPILNYILGERGRAILPTINGVVLLLEYEVGMYDIEIKAYYFESNLFPTGSASILNLDYYDNIEQIIPTQTGYYFVIKYGEDTCEDYLEKYNRNFEFLFEYVFQQGNWYGGCTDYYTQTEHDNGILVFAADDSVIGLTPNGAQLWPHGGIHIPSDRPVLESTFGNKTIMTFAKNNDIFAQIIDSEGHLGLQGNVDAPVFSPSPGTYDGPIEVSLACQTTNAKIYYTLDGSNPLHYGIAYSSTITLEKTSTIRAVATKENWNNSSVSTAVYQILETGIEQNQLSMPTLLRLHPNYPNPFNQGTVIQYEIPERGFITLDIYNVQGQFIRSIRKQFTAPGIYTDSWDGTNENNQPAGSGLYFIRLKFQNQVVITKILLTK